MSLAWYSVWVVFVGAALAACTDGSRLVSSVDIASIEDAKDLSNGDTTQGDTLLIEDDDAHSDTDVGPSPGTVAIVGATLLGTGDPAFEGRVATLLVDDGVITAVTESVVADASETLDLTGFWVTPAFIDSHVHLRYWDVAADLLAAGVVAAVDLAAPPDFYVSDWAGLDVIGSGPMITAVTGYPTQTWGRDGYGRECATLDDAIAAVDDAFVRGARLIKIPFGAGPDFDDELTRTTIEHAHSLGLPVVAHALTKAATIRAAELGADVLGHTPVERLDDAAIALWSDRVVISTVAAFGATPTTVDNLRRLHQAGTKVLYGTDLGNNRVAGIDPRELGLMTDAGLDFAAILASATSSASDVWGFPDYGGLTPGKAAILLVYARDPREDPTVLASPVEVLDMR